MMMNSWMGSDFTNDDLVKENTLAEDYHAKLEEHLNRYGRARLVAPVFGALAANGQDAELARSMFEKARGAYHPLTNGYIERSLQRAGNE